MKEQEGILNQGLLRDGKNQWIVCSSSQGLPLAGAGAGDETLHEGVAVDAVAGLHLQYSTVQYSTVQYSKVQYSAVQYSTVQYSTEQYSTLQYSIVQYSSGPAPAPRTRRPPAAGGGGSSCWTRRGQTEQSRAVAGAAHCTHQFHRVTDGKKNIYLHLNILSN